MFAAGLAAGCGATSGKADRMDRPSLEIVTRVAWGGELPRVLTTAPARGDVAGSATWQTPALPVVRVAADGALAVLAFLDGRFAADDALAWATARDGQVTWRRAPDPFAADRGALTAVDLWLAPTGGAVVLETIASARAQVILAGPDGSSRGVALDGGPFVRLVPDDRGRLYLVRHVGGGALVPLDPATGATGAPIAVTPGSRLALAANRGAAIPSALLAQPASGKVAAPAALPQALIHLLGVDRHGDYYTRADDTIARVSFAGEVRSKLALGEVTDLRPAADGPVRGQLAPAPAWQVDDDGRVYLPRATPTAFEVVRLTLPR